MLSSTMDLYCRSPMALAYREHKIGSSAQSRTQVFHSTLWPRALSAFFFFCRIPSLRTAQHKTDHVKQTWFALVVCVTIWHFEVEDFSTVKLKWPYNIFWDKHIIQVEWYNELIRLHKNYKLNQHGILFTFACKYSIVQNILVGRGEMLSKIHFFLYQLQSKPKK